jgi:hypothetical protein
MSQDCRSMRKPIPIASVTPTEDEKLMHRALEAITDLLYICNTSNASDEVYNVHSALNERLKNVRD